MPACFGLSTLPPLFVRVLVALSRHTDVHYFQFWAGAPASPHEEALLGALGKLGAEFDKVLRDTLAERGLSLTEHELGVPSDPERLFGCLPTGLEKPAVTVHACHGPMREVEVLHDELLALLTRNDDPIAPEDVMVLVPNLEGLQDDQGDAFVTTLPQGDQENRERACGDSAKQSERDPFRRPRVFGVAFVAATRPLTGRVFSMP